MAAEIKTAKIVKFNAPRGMPRRTAFDTSGKDAVFTAGDDGKTLIILTNTDETPATVTVKAGTGFAGAGDLVFRIERRATVCLCLESGKFSDRGKIRAVSTTEKVTAQAVELP